MRLLVEKEREREREREREIRLTNSFLSIAKQYDGRKMEPFTLLVENHMAVYAWNKLKISFNAK